MGMDRTYCNQTSPLVEGCSPRKSLKSGKCVVDSMTFGQRALFIPPHTHGSTCRIYTEEWALEDFPSCCQLRRFRSSSPSHFVPRARIYSHSYAYVHISGMENVGRRVSRSEHCLFPPLPFRHCVLLSNSKLSTKFFHLDFVIIFFWKRWFACKCGERGDCQCAEDGGVVTQMARWISGPEGSSGRAW